MKKETLLTLRDLRVLPQDPWIIFENWLRVGLALKSGHPDAVALGTISERGTPAVRYVLHKGVEHHSIQFVTNYESTKGRELERNPVAALTYYWPEIQRQIRVEGKVARASAAASDAYWQTRSRESQIGAWASDQSREIPAREFLDARVAELSRQYANQPIPRPPHWGMLTVQPEVMDFLHLQSGRLHDRVTYRLESSGQWDRRVLAP